MLLAIVGLALIPSYDSSLCLLWVARELERSWALRFSHPLNIMPTTGWWRTWGLCKLSSSSVQYSLNTDSLNKTGLGKNWAVILLMEGRIWAYICCLCASQNTPHCASSFMKQNHWHIIDTNFKLIPNCKFERADNISFSFVCFGLAVMCIEQGVDVHTINLLSF